MHLDRVIDRDFTKILVEGHQKKSWRASRINQLKTRVQVMFQTEKAVCKE
jgi:hypothetical protein